MGKTCLRVIFATFLISAAMAQKQEIAWSNAEKPIYDQLHDIRKVPDDKRGQVTKDLALKIRALPSSPNKLRLAVGLASRATEGDFGHENLQEVATTLAAAIKEQQPSSQDPYLELASLVRYEHVDAFLDSTLYSAAMAKLEADDQSRQQADFTLTDLDGKAWNLKDLKGKVVLLNFWATWCPPCRKEMPDLEMLYRRFGAQGLIILGIDDEEAETVKPFIAQQGITYPVLLDPGRKVNTLFQIEGIPKTFVYDRDGKIVAQSIDMRTGKQFLEMLGSAGLE
ncbi:MAG TPA: TlpA disulfide reductase family protein [Terriglobales bacterium]|jgi:peroxiredoxin|nr:TlpA disulfide reductase family protein [Terriglobales bacterium]